MTTISATKIMYFDSMIACTIEQCKRLEWFAYTHMLLFTKHKEYTRHSYHQVICQTTNKQTWDIVRHIMNVSTAVTAEQSLRLLLLIMDAIIIILLVNQSPLSFRLIIISIHRQINQLIIHRQSSCQDFPYSEGRSVVLLP